MVKEKFMQKKNMWKVFCVYKAMHNSYDYRSSYQPLHLYGYSTNLNSSVKQNIASLQQLDMLS